MESWINQLISKVLKKQVPIYKKSVKPTAFYRNNIILYFDSKRGLKASEKYNVKSLMYSVIHIRNVIIIYRNNIILYFDSKRGLKASEKYNVKSLMYSVIHIRNVIM